ncbi:hypothetical protein [Scytonema sp. NUACC26]
MAPSRTKPNISWSDRERHVCTELIKITIACSKFCVYDPDLSNTGIIAY